MSVCHWICEGIGVKDDDIYEYLNFEKCLSEIKKLYPDSFPIQEMTPDSFDGNALDDLVWGDPFNCIGDFLSQLDSNNVLSYG